MISVSPQDRDVLRFLWVDDIHKKTPEIVVFRFTRVVFGVSSSHFLLNATIKHHLERYKKEFPEFVQTFLRSVYVDDVSFGAEDDNSTYELYWKSKNVLAEGGFNLRKFITNSADLQKRIDQNESKPMARVNNGECKIEDEDKTYTKSLLGGRIRQCEDEQKILGMRWNFVHYELIFDLSELAILISNMHNPTKRQIVGIATRFYDPIGFVSPVIISFKKLFQELCTNKIDWDEPLSGQLLHKWTQLVSGFQGVSTSIPRCYFSLLDKASSQCSLQGFCDASVGAYAAVVYLRIENYAGNIVNFVASKTRVSPTSRQSIPRLELLSALLLARLIDNISSALEVEKQLQQHCCFTDSKVVLYWIKGITKEWKPFVENRVSELRKLVPAECWRHCPGKQNPADIPSRDATPAEIASCKLWRHGPDWLVDFKREFEEDNIRMPEECLKEMKVSYYNLTHSSSTTNEPSSLDKAIVCENFSRLQRLLRVTAYVIRFVEQLKPKLKNENIPFKADELTSLEISRAEVMWIKQVQRNLTSNKAFQVWGRQFDLFLEGVVWRCRGRISNANIPYSTKHPALLCKLHHFTLLIVRDAHERVAHNGVKETLTEIRSKFWIIRGRQFVRQILHGCVTCRKSEGQSYSAPPPPPLPECRVTESPAFSYTGVDLAGPLYIKDKGSTTNNKVWICLFTCCVTRAVHLDIVLHMTAEAFLRCFKRFTGRRGFPQKMVSNNAKTFKSAAKTIHTILSNAEVQQYLSGIGMEWVFNLERAPWWGGIFERMIKSTKRCLRRTIGQARLTYDELMTSLVEVKMILNSTPLSYVSTEDIEEPLTPSHLMTGQRLLSLPDAAFYHGGNSDMDFSEMSQGDLNTRMKHLNVTLNHFWKRWRGEYLLQLREYHSHDKRSKGKEQRFNGEVVLLRSDNKLRGFWKLARVQKVLRGKDGQIRGAVLKVSGNRKH